MSIDATLNCFGPMSILPLTCRGGEIGRRAGLKIRSWQQGEGSSPSPGTKGQKPPKIWRFRGFFRRLGRASQAMGNVEQLLESPERVWYKFRIFRYNKRSGAREGRWKANIRESSHAEVRCGCVCGIVMHRVIDGVSARTPTHINRCGSRLVWHVGRHGHYTRGEPAQCDGYILGGRIQYQRNR